MLTISLAKARLYSHNIEIGNDTDDIGKEIKLSSIGGNVTLKCFVESFPKAITYWTKESNHPEYFDRLIEERFVHKQLTNWK